MRAPGKRPPGPMMPLLLVALVPWIARPAAADLALRPFDAGLPRAGQWRNGFDVGDMNGDGHADLVFPPPRKGAGHPAMFLGDGKGGWRRWEAAAFPAGLDYGDAAVADFDGDGHADVALAVHLRGIALLRGDGEGRFRAWAVPAAGEAPLASRFAAGAIVAGDLDGDGRPDLVALGEGPRPPAGARAGGKDAVLAGSYGVRALWNRGDGVWEERRVGDDAGFGRSLAVGDFDGDGRRDVVTGSHRPGVRALLRRGGRRRRADQGPILTGSVHFPALSGLSTRIPPTMPAAWITRSGRRRARSAAI